MKNFNNEMANLAIFMHKKQEQLEELLNKIKENDTNQYWCDECNTYVHVDKLDWLNDCPLCPYCESKINL